ncbi:ABC transporter permease [Prolixibacter bellariivorans]|uniref:ABC transporter permease n=1 Tax=Prolixibacter bellariivorans TaxID=314319 RepID=A0A5M4B3U6_9BACT|nr:ABC transporter permease [Prolixibacter bellariivorans]GET34588.1 ABC transporter permease [Prolixibacter bellariivorans]
MFLKNIKTFIRHLSQNKLYTAITIISFSISLMFVILLSVYLEQEYSVDEFNANKNRIFRLAHDDYSGFAPPSGPLLMEKFPEMEYFTRTYDQQGYAYTNKDEKMKISYLMVDSCFFKMFSFHLIEGTPETALLPKSIVLTKEYALKIFGKIPELGSIVNINDQVDYKVGGILDKWPANTHFAKQDALVDFPSLADMWEYPQVLTTYNNNSFGLYVMEKPNTNLPDKAPKILKLFKDVNWMYKNGSVKEVNFEPLCDVYFSKSYSPGVRQNSKTLLTVLSAIIFMILFLSVLNYINLTIAQSGTRSKEIAIKKLMGSRKGQILAQYTFESIFLSLISFFIAFLLSFIVLPIFNHLLDTHLNLDTSFSWQFLGLLVGGAIIIGAISGIIPALTIARFDPIAVVKGAFRMKSKQSYTKGLVAFQYFMIIVLVTSSIFINKQTRFMRNFDLGFNKDNILIINNTIANNQRNSFQSELMAIPGVKHVCFVRGNPVDGGNNNSFTYHDKPLSFQVFQVDTSYFRMMGMDVHLTGAAYSTNAILLNETAVKDLDLPDNPTSVKLFDKETPVYGIVKDFHFRNLKEKVGPVYFRIMSPKMSAWSIMVKVSGRNTFETTQKIKAAYTKFTHGLPVEMKFMDDSINQWYDRETRIGKMVEYFTLLTILISVMGLFAMSLYFVQQKIKEIGIRKVNGAKVSEVMTMLNKDFVKWVAIAFVIATPIAWFAMHKWLENFAYKTTLSWWIFALSGILALGIALLTVSFQSWKAATRNPVEALRYE